MNLFKIFSNFKVLIFNYSIITCISLFVFSDVFALNIQQFSRSNSLTFEMLEDARTRNSHVHNDYDLLATFGLSFVDSPLVVKNSPNSKQLDVVVDNMVAAHLGLAYYLKPWLQLGLTTNYARFHNIHNTYSSGLADINLRAKIRLISKESYALAVIPSVSIPTSGGESFITDLSLKKYGTHNVLSDDSIGFGGRLIFEYLFGWGQFVANLGYRVSSEAKLVDDIGFTHIDMTKRLYTGVGMYVPISETAGVNVEWARLWSNPLFNQDINPNELYGGVSFGIWDRLHGFAGVGLGNPFQELDGNDFRVIVGVKYSPLIGESKKVQTKVVYVPDDLNAAKCKGLPIFDNSNSAVVRYPVNIGDIDANARERIIEIISRVNKKKNFIEHISIVGHTSIVGDASYNKRLSQKRSDSIRSLFIEMGIDAKLISAEGKGEEETLVEGDNKYAHERNRRTEFHIEIKKTYKHCIK